MFLSYGSRPTSENGRKRKGVDEYAAENREDFTANSVIRDGQLVRILICRFCSQVVGARSDRIKEHLISKRHQKSKFGAPLKAMVGRDLSQKYSNDSIAGRGQLSEPPITKPEFPNTLEVRKPAFPTPTQRAIRKHILNSRQPQSNSVTNDPLSLPRGKGAVRVRGGNSSGLPATLNSHTSPIPHKQSAPQQQPLCIRWRNFNSNIITMFSKLKNLEQFCDVTLWCEGKTIKCHKLVLSASSTYFEQLLTENSNLQTVNVHPIIFLRDMRFCEVQTLVEFMYKGEVNINLGNFQSLRRAAESLQIKALGSFNDLHYGSRVGGLNEHSGSAGNSVSHIPSGYEAEHDLSNRTLDMTYLNNQLGLADENTAAANDTNQRRVVDMAEENIPVRHTSNGSCTNANNGNHSNQNINLDESRFQFRWSIPLLPSSHISPVNKEERKETSQDIYVPKRRKSDDLGGEDNQDYITAQESVKLVSQSDMNYEDLNKTDWVENYAESNYTKNDHSSQVTNDSSENE